MHRSSAAQFSVLSDVVIKDLTTQITVLSEGIDALLRTHGYFSKKGALMGERKSQVVVRLIYGRKSRGKPRDITSAKGDKLIISHSQNVT